MNPPSLRTISTTPRQATNDNPDAGTPRHAPAPPLPPRGHGVTEMPAAVVLPAVDHADEAAGAISSLQARLGDRVEQICRLWANQPRDLAGRQRGLMLDLQNAVHGTEASVELQYLRALRAVGITEDLCRDTRESITEHERCKAEAPWVEDRLNILNSTLAAQQEELSYQRQELRDAEAIFKSMGGTDQVATDRT